MVQSDINFKRSTGGNKFDSRLKGIRGCFLIFHVKVKKKVTTILRLGKKNSFSWFAKLGGQGNSANIPSSSF
jgi:hypothetical protein